MRGPRAVAAVTALLVLAVLSGCSTTARPLCEQAGELADANRLGAAMARYVEAERAGEGGCATDGQQEVQERQREVGLVLGRAAAAERRDAIREAEDLYVRVLTLDVDNADARSGLGRLQALATAPVPTFTPAPAQQAPRGGGLDPWVVVLLTVLALVGIATGIIVSLVQPRDRRRAERRAGLPWAPREGEGDGGGRRVARLEEQVTFLLHAVEELAATSPVPLTRTVAVPPRRPPDGPRSTSVSDVTVLRLPDTTLLVVCRRIVHEPDRPGDDLVADVDRLGSADTTQLGPLLEEASIAAVTKGQRDPTWRLVQEAWQLTGSDVGPALAGQLLELLVGRGVVLPPSATALPPPLDGLAERVGGEVSRPGDEPAPGARVLLQATSLAARPVGEPSVLLTGVIRSLRYDMVADTVTTALRDGLQHRAELALREPEAPRGSPAAAGP